MEAIPAVGDPRQYQCGIVRPWSNQLQTKGVRVSALTSDKFARPFALLNCGSR